jgi:four helix bundle protein
MKKILSAKDLIVYKKAFSLSMEIFHVSKTFPKEEVYSLTSQIRRSSRSVCLNLSEAWAKRRYEAHFISKLTDCDAENSETSTAIDFAFECEFIDAVTYRKFKSQNDEIGRMLGAMINNPESFLIVKK